MRISIVSDEIDLDFEKAVKCGVKLGINNFELRIIEGNRIPHISKESLQKIIKVIKEYNIKITALSPGLLKSFNTLRENGACEDSVLVETITVAKKLGTNIIITFGEKRPCGMKDSSIPLKIIEILRKMANKCRNEGIILAIENEPGYWADTGENTKEMIEAVGCENLKSNWDPANSFLSGEIPYPDGYNYVRSYVSHVHLKDVAIRSKQKEFVAFGEGEIDWNGQLKALSKDQYSGFLSIETHVTPRIENSEQSFRNLKNMLKNI